MKKRNYDAVRRIYYQIAMAYSLGKSIHLNDECKKVSITPEIFRIAIKKGIITKEGRFHYKPVIELTNDIIDSLYNEHSKIIKELTAKNLQIQAENLWANQIDEDEPEDDLQKEIIHSSGDELTIELIKERLQIIVKSLNSILDLL